MWLLLACAGPTAKAPLAEDPEDAEVETLPGDTSPPDTDTSTPPEDDPSCASLYDADTVLDVELTIEPAAWRALEQDYASGQKDYHPVHVRIGEDEADAHVRLKGNPGFSWFIEKMQFVIAFNHEDPDARFHGLRKIALDASWYEPTMLRDRLSWSVMSTFPETLFGACVNNATLTINGAYYGIYANIEFFDHEWLERTMGRESATGTLWKYGTEPVANAEAADRGRLRALQSARTLDALQAVGEVDQWLDMWAAEAVLGDTDGYLCCEHNYYLYDHPTRGILFVPWDFDLVMDAAPYTSDPIKGYGREGMFDSVVIQTALADPDTHAAYVERVAVLNAALADPSTLQHLDAWDAQITPDALADPTRSWGDVERETTVAAMRAWIPQRTAFIDAWVACERGPLTDADADGHDVCTDIDDGDPTRYPGAVEACNGLDDDGNGVVDDAVGCDDCRRHDADEDHLLFCSAKRSAADAATNCATHGGTLGNVNTTGAYYLTYIHTWPNEEEWWLDGRSGGGCTTWDEGQRTTSSEACSALLRSVCIVPA